MNKNSMCLNWSVFVERCMVKLASRPILACYSLFPKEGLTNKKFGSFVKALMPDLLTLGTLALFVFLSCSDTSVLSREDHLPSHHNTN